MKIGATLFSLYMMKRFSLSLSSVTMILAVITTFVLLFLKITGVGLYSWFWVFFPMILGIGLVVTYIVLFLLFMFIVAVIQALL